MSGGEVNERAPAGPDGPRVAEALGAALGPALTRLEQLAQALRAGRGLGGAELADFEAALAQVHRVTVRSQQLGRLARGGLRQSHEKLALHEVVHQALLDRHAAFQAAGIEVLPYLRPVEVLVDAGLLVSVVETALDWAARPGVRLQVKVELKNWPEHGLLAVRGEVPAGAASAPAGPDDLAGLLLPLLAAALGLDVTQAVQDRGWQLVLEFPRTVRRLAGLTALDAEPIDPPAPAARSGPVSGTDSRQLAGARVLLLTDDPAVQRDVARVCDRLGLRLDSVPTAAQASRLCALALPDLLVIDEHLHDPEVDQLHQGLVQRRPHFPVIEVAPAQAGFAMSSWDEASSSRIGRDAIVQRLPDAIVLELGKAG